MELILLSYLGFYNLPTPEQMRDAKIQAGINQAHEIQVNDYRRLIERNLFSKPINEQKVINDLRPNSTERIIIKYE